MNRIYLTEILDEILGVPEGIIETTQDLYNFLIEELQKKDKIHLQKFRFVKDFKINDYKFNSISIKLKINENPKYKNIEYASMGFIFGGFKVKPPYKHLYIDKNNTDDIDLIIELVSYPNFTKNDIINYFKSHKNNIISSLSHELKHAYDAFKKNKKSISSSIKYKTSSEIGISMPGLTEFIYYSYYTHITENLVRPTEVASFLKNKGTTKKEFLEDLKKSKVYDLLKNAQTFSYEAMIEKGIANESAISFIIDYFKSKQEEDISELNKEEIFKKLLKLHFINIKKYSISSYENLISNMRSTLVMWGIEKSDFNEEKQKAIEEYKKEINKFSDDNYENFYKYEIKQINKNADKMIRKLAKLYDYI